MVQGRRSRNNNTSIMNTIKYYGFCYCGDLYRLSINRAKTSVPGLSIRASSDYSYGSGAQGDTCIFCTGGIKTLCVCASIDYSLGCQSLHKLLHWINPWQIVHRVRAGYLSGRTRPSAYRIQQLRQLKRLINDNQDDLCQALWHDLHKVYIIKIKINNKLTVITMILYVWFSNI